MSDIPSKIVRSNRRTLALQVLADATLLVKAPMRLSTREIDKFIEEHSEWIQKRTAQLQQMPQVVSRQYKNGEEFFYLGERCVLEIGNHKAITVQDKKILFPQFLLFRIQKELIAWYIQQGEDIISRQVVWYANQMNVSYKSLEFSDTKSRWGSCSHDNKLQFNWRLVMAPLLTINYVVVHELAHTIEKNHSRTFWSKVRFYSPSYRQQRKWLQTHGHSLVI